MKISGDPLLRARAAEVRQRAGQVRADVDFPVRVRDLVDLLAARRWGITVVSFQIVFETGRPTDHRVDSHQLAVAFTHRSSPSFPNAAAIRQLGAARVNNPRYQFSQRSDRLIWSSCLSRSVNSIARRRNWRATTARRCSSTARRSSRPMLRTSISMMVAPAGHGLVSVGSQLCCQWQRAQRHLLLRLREGDCTRQVFRGQP